MSISKKHFISIAKEIKASNTINEVIDGLCFQFKKFNCDFDEYRFRKACGKEE